MPIPLIWLLAILWIVAGAIFLSAKQSAQRRLKAQRQRLASLVTHKAAWRGIGAGRKPTARQELIMHP